MKILNLIIVHFTPKSNFPLTRIMHSETMTPVILNASKFPFVSFFQKHSKKSLNGAIIYVTKEVRDILVEKDSKQPP